MAYDDRKMLRCIQRALAVVKQLGAEEEGRIHDRASSVSAVDHTALDSVIDSDMQRLRRDVPLCLTLRDG